MSLADRLAGVAQWPTSRRVLLLGLPGAGATALAVIVNTSTHPYIAEPMLNVELLNRFIGSWLVVQLLTTLASLPAAIAGRDAPWGAYLFVATQSPFVAGLLWLFGTMATPLVAIFPAIVILWTMYLGPRFGVFGLLNMLLWILLAMALDASGRLPYAPVLLVREIGAQADVIWAATVFSHILVLGGFCLLLCVVSLRSQALQASRLRTMHALLERSNRLIRRYVPTQLAEQIHSGAHDADSKPQRRKLTIVFIDVEGFTALSEQVSPDTLATLLDTYLSEMVAIADDFGGTINQIVGDGIMIFFGAPRATNDRDHALRAVRMAQAMQQRMRELDAAWQRHNLHRPLRARIGINSGYASVGDFGPEGRKLYSGIGLHTNLAARIQQHCTPGEVLMTESTWTLIHDALPCQCRGEVSIRGLQHPVRVYALSATTEQREPVAA